MIDPEVVGDVFRAGVRAGPEDFVDNHHDLRVGNQRPLGGSDDVKGALQKLFGLNVKHSALTENLPSGKIGSLSKDSFFQLCEKRVFGKTNTLDFPEKTLDKKGKSA